MNSSFRSATATFLAATLYFVSLTGCSERTVLATGGSPAAASAAPAGPSPAQAQDPANQPPAGQNPNQPPPQLMSNADLVAPIALYPDALLAQVLSTATNPQEVLDLGNWLLQNQNLKGDAAVSAAEKAGFSPSAQYLVNFPQVVDQMCQQMDWTTQLGQAFKADPKGVLDAVQIRRREAQKMGNLATTPQMVVDTTTQQGQQVIEIKPASPTVVYVPQYNPVTIYTTPAPPQPVVVQQGVSTGTVVGIGLLSFGVGMAVGALIARPNYYPYPSWGYGSMYWGGRPYYPPPYRPVYPGYRPAYGYHPPPNYHWNQYNRQTNITINNNNYYNKFNKNTQINNTQVNRYNQNSNNRQVNQYQNNRPNNQMPTNRPNTAVTGQYQGQRPNTTTGSQRSGSGMANVNPNTSQRPTTMNRPTTGNTQAGTSRPPTSTPNTTRPNTGAGNANSRPTNQPQARTTNQSASRPQNQQMSRPAGGAASPQPRPNNNNGAQKREASKSQGKPQGEKRTGRPEK